MLISVCQKKINSLKSPKGVESMIFRTPVGCSNWAELQGDLYSVYLYLEPCYIKENLETFICKQIIL